MTQSKLVPPHGGKLVDRMASAADAQKLKDAAGSMPSITMSAKQVCDLEMIAIGAFSPLEGFVGPEDFASICTDMRLSDETPWPFDHTRRR